MLPVIYVCNDDYFDFTVAEKYGYTSMNQYVAGNLPNYEGATWEGKYGNITSNQLQEAIFKFNFHSLKVKDKRYESQSYNNILPIKKVFNPSNGYCMKLQNTIQQLSFKTSISHTLLIVDPALDSSVRIEEMKDAKKDFGPTKHGIQTGKVFELKISIHDSRINDGKTCADYDKNDTHYGKCIETALEKQLFKWFGCLPWSSTNSSLRCKSGPVNQFDDSVRIEREMGLYVRGQKTPIFSNCTQPCTKMSLQMLELKSFSDRLNDSFVRIEFLNDVMIYTDVYAYDMFSLVIDLGSSLGLWLGLSALSFFDLFLHVYSVTKQKYLH